MIVRCGACRSQFDAPGAGRFACPACGSVNVVRGGEAPNRQPSAPAAPPPRPPDPPSARMACPQCQFSFIIGEVATAKCPNCGAEVETGLPA
jgi:Zn finger protein HypA/HybF involved in hydrogenase expression